MAQARGNADALRGNDIKDHCGSAEDSWIVHMYMAYGKLQSTPLRVAFKNIFS